MVHEHDLPTGQTSTISISSETFPQQIIRHLKTGVDGPTLIDGAGVIIHRAKKRLHIEDHGKIVVMEFFRRPEMQDYKDVSDLNVTDYQLIDAQTIKPFIASIFEFPVASRLELHIARRKVREHGMMIEQRLLERHDDAIAAVVGPTADYKGPLLLPNNGFFVRDLHSVFVGFPPVITVNDHNRKGAFALTEDQKMVLLDDQEIQKAVDSRFSGFDYITGTSFYMMSGDNPKKLQSLPRDVVEEKRNISYLMQYQTPDSIRDCYFITRMIEREDVFPILDDYANFKGAERWMAVELEYSGAEILVKSPYRLIPFNAWQRTSDRLDHYIIKRNQQGQ